MAKLNWNPWIRIEDFKDKMDRLVDEINLRRRHEKTYLWQPAANVMETRDAYVLEIELPGTKREDVVLEIMEEDLWVYGEQRFEKDVEGGVYHVLERFHGPFARKFSLPGGIDGDSVSAMFENGVLTVTVSKKRKTPGEHIRIDVTQK
ncbi:MAG: Hsp20/alpha crystallin family protein [Thermodesulfobacteriota bacterium]|nr:Hsp20/alpha crystallin family protein [Thermodesulfobacteriota bacterium]